MNEEIKFDLKPVEKKPEPIEREIEENITKKTQEERQELFEDKDEMLTEKHEFMPYQDVLLKYTTKSRIVASLGVKIPRGRLEFSNNKYTRKFKDSIDRVIIPSVDIERGFWNCSCEDFIYRKFICKHDLALLKIIPEEHYEAFINALKGTPIIRPLLPTAYFSTGMKSVDNLFGGGIPRSLVTGLAGEARIGKTWLGYHLCVESVLNGKRALFIDVDGSFEQEADKKNMAIYYADRYNENIYKFYDNIEFVGASDIYVLCDLLGVGLELKKSQKRVMPNLWDDTIPEESPLYSLAGMNEYGIIMIDSITHAFKNEVPVPPNANMSSRAAIINYMWGRMEKISKDFAIPFVVVHHSSKPPEGGFGNIYGGDTILFQMRYIIWILPSTSNERGMFTDGDRARRIWRFRTPTLDSNYKEATVGVLLAKNYGFTDQDVK